ncbi:MAG: hypothetical protein K0R51_2912 [Cytophagaceae bacterium]|nr:hypothetical protein [Cytophagaceae bacterium]
MKKIIFALLTLCMASATQAAAPVPENIKHDFALLFPQATNLVWTEQKEGLYEVDFTFNQQSYAALIDKKGTMLHAGKTLNWFGFPAQVRKTLSTNYAGFSMKVMLKENDHYFAEFTQNGANYMVLLDNTGQVIFSSKE